MNNGACGCMGPAIIPKFDTLRLKMPVQVLKILVFLSFYILRTCRTCNIILLYGGTIWLE